MPSAMDPSIIASFGPSLPDEIISIRPSVSGRAKAYSAVVNIAEGKSLMMSTGPLEPKDEAFFSATVEDAYEEVGPIGMFYLELSPGTNVREICLTLMKRSDVVYAHPNPVSRPCAPPNDSLYDRMWNLERIGMPTTWDISGNSPSGVRVCVIDTGVRITHNELLGRTADAVDVYASTTFTYTVHYYDQDGDSPSTRYVYIDGSPHVMSKYSGSVSNGIYRYQTTLSTGSHNYYFYFADSQGGSDRLPSSGSYSGPSVSAPDTTPPDTSIADGPSGPITYNDVTFIYTGPDNVTSTSNLVYSYKLEGYDSNWSSYTSSTSKSYNDLSNGSYTFYVKAMDLVGNPDPSPASRSFTVNVDECEFDISDPEIILLTVPTEVEIGKSYTGQVRLKDDLGLQTWDVQIYDGAMDECKFRIENEAVSGKDTIKSFTFEVGADWVPGNGLIEIVAVDVCNKGSRVYHTDFNIKAGEGGKAMPWLHLLLGD